jgi:hypothetical protein
MVADQSDEAVGVAWIVERLKSGTGEPGPGFWELNKLCNEDPPRALHIVDLIATKDGSDSVLGVLAAGPLENLLVRHGPLLIDQIEEIAKGSPVFRTLLGGVWQRETEKDVWERVVAARAEKW